MGYHVWKDPDWKESNRFEMGITGFHCVKLNLDQSRKSLRNVFGHGDRLSDLPVKMTEGGKM